MDVKFTIEAVSPTEWTATCKDPCLEQTGTDIMDVCNKMAKALESWFIDTFKTTQKVVVEVPTIKARVNAVVTVRPETPLTEFGSPETKNADGTEDGPEKVMGECVQCGTPILVSPDEKDPICESCKYENETSQPPQPKAEPSGGCIHFSHGGDGIPVGNCNCSESEMPITDIDGV